MIHYFSWDSLWTDREWPGLSPFFRTPFSVFHLFHQWIFESRIYWSLFQWASIEFYFLYHTILWWFGSLIEAKINFCYNLAHFSWCFSWCSGYLFLRKETIWKLVEILWLPGQMSHFLLSTYFFQEFQEAWTVDFQPCRPQWSELLSEIFSWQNQNLLFSRCLLF